MKILIFLLFCTNVQALELRKKVAVVDTGIRTHILKSKHLCTDIDTKDLHNPYEGSFDHGENIINLISKKLNFKKYCIYPINAFPDKTFKYLESLRKVQSLNNLVGLNLSISGGDNKDSFIKEELDILKNLAKRQVKVNVAAGNSGLDLKKNNCHVYPACLAHLIPYKSFKVVKSSTLGVDNKRYSNDLEGVDEAIRKGTMVGTPKMSGTSQSTAIYTGEVFSK